VKVAHYTGVTLTMKTGVALDALKSIQILVKPAYMAKKTLIGRMAGTTGVFGNTMKTI